jgi:hypothetical protein
MKKTTIIFRIILLLFAFYTNITKAQELIRIDILKPFSTLEKKREIHKDEILNIQFSNVNPFLYNLNVKINQEIHNDVSGNIDPRTFSSSLELNLADIKELPSLDLALDFKNKENKYDSARKNKDALEESKKKLLLALDNFYKIEELERIENQLKNTSFMINSQPYNLWDYNLNKEKIYNEINVKEEEKKKEGQILEVKRLKDAIRNFSLKDDYNKLKINLESITFEIDGEINNLNNLDNNILTLQKEIDKKEKEINEKEKKMKDINKNAFIKNSFYDYKQNYRRLQELNSLFKDLKYTGYSSLTHSEFSSKLKLIFSNYNFKTDDRFLGFVSQIKRDMNKIYDYLIQELDNKQDDFKKRLTTFHSNINMNNIEEVARRIILISSKNKEEHWSPILTFGNFDYRTDDLNFEIKLNPNNDILNTFASQKEFDFSVPIVGGAKFNVSLGTSFFLGLSDVKLSRTKINESSSLLVKEPDLNDVKPQLTTFLNIFERGRGQAKFAGNIGIGTDTESISYLVGIGGIFGRQERIILHAGVAFTQVEVLNPNYNNLIGKKNQIIVEKPIDEFINEDLTLEKYKLGLYFGFSYNLSKNREEKFQKFKSN